MAGKIKRLEEANVIEGHALTISPKALGLRVAAWRFPANSRRN
jgi:hypothetical protein